MPDKPDQFKVMEKIIEAGLKNFTAHKVEVQDGVVVCMVLRIEDKEVKITR
jgi:hypothetical protein